MPFMALNKLLNNFKAMMNGNAIEDKGNDGNHWIMWVAHLNVEKES